MKKASFIIALSILGSSISFGKTASNKKRVADLTVIEAYNQQTNAGIPGRPSKTDVHIVLKWNVKTYPETFFWRGDVGFLPCQTEKAHKLNKKKNTTIVKGVDYETVAAAGDEIHKGDTLMLVPIIGGKYPVPKEIPADAKNTLYYKTNGSGWKSVKIKTLTTKEAIAMP